MRAKNELWLLLWLASCAPGGELELADSFGEAIDRQAIDRQGFDQQGTASNYENGAHGYPRLIGFELSSIAELALDGTTGSTMDLAALVKGRLRVLRSRVTGTTPSLSACASYHDSNPARSCGWSSAGLGYCSAGSPVTLSRLPGTTCSPNSMIRVCSGSSPCEAGAALVAAAGSGTSCPQVSFTCPAGQSFTVMTASGANATTTLAPMAVRPNAMPNAIYPFYNWAAGTTRAVCDTNVGGARRSCGFHTIGFGQCTPATPVSLQAEAGHHGCAAQYTLRACEGSLPCDPREALAGGALASGAPIYYPGAHAVSHACPAISFVCPASGSYHLMIGGSTSDITQFNLQDFSTSTRDGAVTRTLTPFRVVASSGIFPFIPSILPASFTESSLAGQKLRARVEYGDGHRGDLPMYIGAVLPELAGFRGYDDATRGADRYSAATSRYEVWAPVLEIGEAAECVSRRDAPRSWDAATETCSAPLCGIDAVTSAAGTPIDPNANDTSNLAIDGVWADQARVAIPVAGVWGLDGARQDTALSARSVDSAESALFTFSCRLGVIGKCYRWGYRWWDSAVSADPSGNTYRAQMLDAHQACTRMARADYCGDGRSWTQTGTPIDHWDQFDVEEALETSAVWLDPELCRSGYPVSSKFCRQPASGSYVENGNVPEPPPGRGAAGDPFFFEAGWNPNGAVCLSKTRWDQLNQLDPSLPSSPFSDCSELLANPAYLESLAEDSPDRCSITVGSQVFQGFWWPHGSSHATCRVPSVCDSAQGACICEDGHIRPYNARSCPSDGQGTGTNSCTYFPGAMDFGTRGTVGVDPGATYLFNASQHNELRHP